MSAGDSMYIFLEFNFVRLYHTTHIFEWRLDKLSNQNNT
jgi:hypothetical protein